MLLLKRKKEQGDQVKQRWLQGCLYSFLVISLQKGVDYAADGFELAKSHYWVITSIIEAVKYYQQCLSLKLLTMNALLLHVVGFKLFEHQVQKLLL